jgi:hypothetical protein
MINLYRYNPGAGQMQAPNPPGLILAVFFSGPYGAIFIVSILSIILKIIDEISNPIQNYLELNIFEISIFKTLIFVEWLWISPRSAVFYIIFLFIILISMMSFREKNFD